MSLLEHLKRSRGDAAASGSPRGAQSPDPALEVVTHPLGDVERARLLHLAVRRWGAEGAVVESMGAHQAVLRWGRTTPHHRHLLASVCTLGCWLPVWLVLARLHAARRRRVQLSVDEFGRIDSRVLPPDRLAR